MVISEETPLIFMHIPKTGGMSLFTAFCSYWGDRIADLYNVSCARPLPALTAIDNRQLCLYCGHFSFGLHEWFNRPVYYASVVREPVDRVVSLYHFVRPTLKKIRQVMLSERVGAREVMRKARAPDYYADFVDWLEGEQTPEVFLSCPSADLDNGMVRRFSGVGRTAGSCPVGALDAAKANIERFFSVVGVLERYPDTLRLMAGKLGLPGLAENRVNVNRNKVAEEPLSYDWMRRIAAMNALDIELYRWVNDRLDAELGNPIPAIQVPGGGRRDELGATLWHAVGNSPLRDAAMKLRGVPFRPQPGAPALVRQYVA